MQPNTQRAQTFAQSFISSGGIEALLVLLQREAKTGDRCIVETHTVSGIDDATKIDSKVEATISEPEGHDKQLESPVQSQAAYPEVGMQNEPSNNGSLNIPSGLNIERMTSASENQLLRKLGGISFSITADSARSNVYNIDNGDGILVGIIHILGALVMSGHVKLCPSATASSLPGYLLNTVPEEGSTMFDDKVALLLFALQKAFQAAPKRLMTSNIYMALIAAAVWLEYFSEQVNKLFFQYIHGLVNI